MNFFLLLFAFFGLSSKGLCDAVAAVSFSEEDVQIVLGENHTVTLQNIPQGVVYDILSVDEDRVVFEPKSVSSSSPSVILIAQNPGHVVLNATKSGENTTNLFLRVTVLRSEQWDTFSVVIGWVYFAAWTISFYPQIYDNWKRKSVVGLNFDFIALNLVGFFLYSLYNCGLYWIGDVREIYLQQHVGGLIPVMVNDIVFGLHAFSAVAITIVQCYFYERAEQTVSRGARGYLGVIALFLLISVILAGVDVINWLDFLTYCSYVKLSITLIKYIPQAYMNFRRKSTSGWSIGNVFLDFTGGLLSMMQMIVNGWNFDDWDSIFGDLTKFGLGLFSVVFDIFFIVQHYILYRHSYQDFPESSANSRSELVSQQAVEGTSYQKDDRSSPT